MKIDVVADGSYRRKVQISVPASTVKAELDRAYNDLRRRVNLRGFRKGKAPRKVLEMRFGPNISADVAAQLIQQGYTDAIQGNDLDPVGQPTVEDRGELDTGADFQFTIAVDVRPQVELTQYEGLDVEYPSYDVTDDELDAAIRARLEAQTRLVEVTDRGVEAGDMVLCELVGKDGDTEVFREPGTMIRTEADPYYPGVDALLVGMSTGDEKTESVDFPEGAQGTGVAGRTLDVTAKVLSVQANQVPDLTDEIAEELGYEGGADGMKLAVKGELDKGRDDMARNQARANLLQALIDANPFDVPDGMVDQQLDMLVNELKLQQAYRGVDPRSINFNEAQMADLRIRAGFAVKGGLILDFVSNTQKIEVTDADLDAKYQELADERGQTVEAIKGYFVKDDAVEELRARLLEEMTLDWLLERANIVGEGEAKKAAPKKAAAKKPAKKAAPKKAAAKKEAKADAPAAGGADLSILKGAIKAVKEALDSGDHDAHLAELLEAEKSGKARAGAIKAIEARM